MLESLCYSDNAFVTLTYAEGNEPAGGSLEPKDLKLWLKRFRKAIEPLRIRYYAVGEYGDVNFRPHYHAALFGYPSCSCRMRNAGKPHGKWVSCSICALIRDTWGYGIVHVGNVEKHTAGYIAGYITKKMTRRDDVRLAGREPEFARMSLKPGIGANFLFDAASSSMQYGLDLSDPDAPSHLLFGGKPMPLGRYLRQKYREYIGKDKNAPKATLDEQAEKMRPMLVASIKNETSFKDEVVKAGDQLVQNDKTRRSIFKSRRSL